MLRDLLDTRERPVAPLFGGGDAGPAAVGGARHGGTAPAGWGFVDEARTDGGAPGTADGEAAPAEPTRRWGLGRRGRKPRPARREPVEQRSLFGEILDWMFAPLLLLWPLSVAVTFVVARSLADAPFDRALDDRTEALGQQVMRVAPERIAPKPDRAPGLLAADEEEIVWFQVVGPNGRVVAGEPDLPRPGLYDFPTQGRVKLRNASFRGEAVRVGYLYLELGDEGSAPVLVQVAETLDRRTRLANEIIKGVIFPQFLILPVAVLLVWFGLSRGLAPLKSLQQHIRERSPDDLSPIDAKAAPEEIAPLVDTFNDLLERLSENVAAQKRFIADAAHQLKTPLAGLRTQTELALRERDPVELRRALEQIARGSTRTAHLVSQLLSLARMENLREAEALVPLDLAAVVREVVADWVPAAIERGIDLGFEVVRAQHDAVGVVREARIDVDGNPLLLRELTNNLVDNALRYTPRGGTVTVRVVGDGRLAHLQVEDSGPGVPEAERTLVFERFYRVLGTGVDGSGLGLPIVREIAERHDATVTVEDAHPGAEPPGARFVVAFPLSGARRAPL